MDLFINLFCCFILGFTTDVIAATTTTSATSTEPACFDIENNPAMVNATIQFLIHSKECQTDAGCADLPETAGLTVCPPMLKACMSPIQVAKMLDPTECLAANLTTGATTPDCATGFRRNQSTKCEYSGPRVCTSSSDCPDAQKCMTSKWQPFKSMRCYTSCDSAAEKVAETNNWQTQCGMTRHMPPGEKKSFVQKFFGCCETESICGFKQPRADLVRIMTAGAIPPPADPATTA